MNKHKGLLSIELVVTLGVLMTLAGVLAAMGISFGKLNDHLWLRYTCQAAGQAQMDAIASTGKPIIQEQFDSLWPGVTCEISTTPGTGQWDGLKRVHLSLNARKKKDAVQIEMFCYLPEDKGAGDEQ